MEINFGQAHAVNIKETYENFKIFVQNVKYQKCNQNISGDLKFVAVFIGLELGYTKYSCFFFNGSAHVNKIIKREKTGRNVYVLFKENFKLIREYLINYTFFYFPLS